MECGPAMRCMLSCGSKRRDRSCKRLAEHRRRARAAQYTDRGRDEQSCICRRILTPRLHCGESPQDDDSASSSQRTKEIEFAEVASFSTACRSPAGTLESFAA